MSLKLSTLVATISLFASFVLLDPARAAHAIDLDAPVFSSNEGDSVDDEEPVEVPEIANPNGVNAFARAWPGVPQ